MSIEAYHKEFLNYQKDDLFYKWEEVREEMFIHTRGLLPEKLLKKRRPNEDEAVYNYRLETYEPITKGSMNKAIDKLYRMFQAANYSIKVSERIEEYLTNKRFKNEFFISYIQKYVLRRMIEDPNGLIAWLPTGEGLFDPSVKVDVKSVIIGSNQIVYYSDDFLTWKDDKEKSLIKVGGSEVYSGEIYHTLTVIILAPLL